MAETQLSVMADVEGLGKVVEVESDFFNEIRLLEAGGARLISARDEAYARLQTQGKENIGRNYGTRTTGGFEYARGRVPLFRVNSRLTTPKLAKLAVEANRAGSYFHTPSTKEYEESAAIAEKEAKLGVEPKDRSVIFLPHRRMFGMFDKHNWEIYQAILKDQAKPFFELNGTIVVYPTHRTIVDAQDGTILTQLYFKALDNMSGFHSDNHSLYCGSAVDFRARGILL